MEYEDLIDETDDTKPKGDPTDDVVDDVIEPAPVVAPKKPWKAFALTGLLASLIGAGGGGYGVYAGLKAQTSQVKAPELDVASVTGPLNTKIKTLETRLAATEKDLRAVQTRPEPATETVDLARLEARLTALEATSSTELDPEAIKALQSAQADGFEWPDVTELETRLVTLEGQIEALPDASVETEALEVTQALLPRLEQIETSLSQNAKANSAASKQDVAKLAVLTKRLAVLEKKASAPVEVNRVTLLAFPKDQLMEAVTENTQGGFMAKALSKHVRVKDEDDPRTLINGIETDIAEGRLEAATKKFERLPAPVKTAGQAWYESVKASL